MTSWTLPRESVELVGPITATANGVAVTTFEVALIPNGARPVAADWSAPVLVVGSRYVLVGPGSRPLTPGQYVLWLRYTAAPETPVLDSVGIVVVT